MSSNRRTFLLSLASFAGVLAGPTFTFSQVSRAAAEALAARLRRHVETYVGFGMHFSGGGGDTASGDRLQAYFADLGFKTSRQVFEAPAFSGETGELQLADGTRLRLLRQGPGAEHDGKQRLCLWAAGMPAPTDCAGALLVYDSNYARHSSLKAPEWRQVLEAVAVMKPAALIAITNGPSNEAIRLNVPPTLNIPPFALIAPREAAPLRAAAARGESANLFLKKASGTLPASNVVARRKGPGPVVVLSTPRSGWGLCAAERGPGIAIFLELARFVAENWPRVDLHCIASSGHEYENLGAHAYLLSGAPKPERTDLWVHLGANLAGRDYHDLGSWFAPLPTPDPQRYLGVTTNLEDAARTAFAGRPGLEQAYVMSKENAAGELKEILAAGYPVVAGAFGANRFHHTLADTLDKVDMDEIEPTALAFQRLVAAFLNR